MEQKQFPRFGVLGGVNISAISTWHALFQLSAAASAEWKENHPGEDMPRGEYPKLFDKGEARVIAINLRTIAGETETIRGEEARVLHRFLCSQGLDILPFESEEE